MNLHGVGQAVCVSTDDFTSQGVGQAGMQLSDGLVELEQLGGHGPQLLEMRRLGLLFIIDSVRAGLSLLHVHAHT